MMTNSLRLKKKNEKKNSIYSPKPIKLCQDLSQSSKSLSINDLISCSPIGRNKTKTMITSLLSSSKGIIRDKRQYNSSTNFPQQFKHFYPFKPNNSQNLLNFSNNEEKTKLILSPKISEPIRNINEYNSSKKYISFRPLSSSRFMLNKYYRNIKLRKHQLYINRDRDSIHADSPLINFNNIKNSNIEKENEKNKSNDTEGNINEYLNENRFINYIDEINKNSNYINKCKNNIKEYFITDEKRDGNKHIFEELLNKYKFDEYEHENYFSSDIYSTKKNSFNIGNFTINFKITSLKFIFYEIIGDSKNIDNNIFYNIENKAKIKYNTNTKIKFPFEFLSVFYGIELNDFISFVLSVIEYEQKNNKFIILNNNFISKIEIGKTLYDFFTEMSYFYKYNNNESKECLIYDWEIKNSNNIIKHFVLKIMLPQMKISIKGQNMNKIKFFSNINIKTMGDLINNSFNKWDYYILIYFSELKIFRFEINKILCGKYINNNQGQKTEVKKILFNLNQINTILNTIKKNDSSYGFFYININKYNYKNESYYIDLKLPKIKISYQNLLYCFNKKFDIDIKRLSQINKLRKSFRPEDLIKYSMTIIKNKNNKSEELEKIKKFLSSKKTIKPFKRASSLVNRDKTRSDSKRSNSSNKSNKKRILRKDTMQSKIQYSKNYNPNDEVIKDIKLNLDKYIFNFDESILKYIKVENNTNIIKKNFNKVLNIKKNYSMNHSMSQPLLRRNTNNFSKNNIDSINNEKKWDIEIGTMELSWTNQDALTKNILLNKKDSEYLLEYPPFQWKFFVEKNIEIILSDETNMVRPIRRSSKKTLIARLS